MDLYRGHAGGLEGVKKGDAGVGVCAGVDDDPVKFMVSVLDRIYEDAFVVGLHKFCFHPLLPSFRPDLGHKIVIGGPAV